MEDSETPRTLREILEDAEARISQYKHPNIDEAKDRLNDLLVEAGLGNISHDTIEYLSIGQEKVYLLTRYSIRSCEQEDRFEFPTSVIDAQDPIAAIKSFAKGQRITEARRRFAEATQEWTDARNHLEEMLKS